MENSEKLQLKLVSTDGKLATAMVVDEKTDQPVARLKSATYFFDKNEIMASVKLELINLSIDAKMMAKVTKDGVVTEQLVKVVSDRTFSPPKIMVHMESGDQVEAAKVDFYFDQDKIRANVTC